MTEHAQADQETRAERDRLLMRQASNLLAADLSLGELFERLTRILAEYIDSSVVFIALARPDGNHAIEYIYDHGDIRRYPHIELSAGSRARAVMQTSEIIWGNTPGEWAPQGSNPINRDRPWTNDSLSAIFVPMRSGGTVVGCLSVQSVREGAYDRHEVEVVAAIGHYLGVAVQNQRMYQALQRTAEYDRLTGLANHSKLLRELDAALAEASETRPATAIMLNILNFTVFNEIYGHLEGDGVLRRVADALREFEDEDVLAGRFGGDVFMVLRKPNANEAVEAFVERLSRRLSELSYLAQDQMLPISLACGYVVAPLNGTSRHDLIALCGHRTRCSRKQACRPIGEDELETYVVHGTYAGLETVVDALLDRDPYTRVHLFQVNSMAKLWSEFNLELDAERLEKILQASLLHDLGKLLISDRILVKPGRLSNEEYLEVQQHAVLGRNVLSHHEGFEEVAEIVGQHHERWDGAGYPQGLAGEEIHPLSRAISILDAFSAMVADRPYHRGITEDAALIELQRCSGTQFDPELVERFVRWREETPAPPTT